MKRAWKKPEIKMLVRGESEESVLYNCKGWQGTGDGGPFGGNECYDESDYPCAAVEYS